MSPTSGPLHRQAGVDAAVAAGGALGTAARYGLGRWFPEPLGRFPWTTLGVNVTGSLALGMVLYIVFEHRPASRFARPFLAIGVLGGFTTFSTFAVETVQRGQDHPWTAAAYVVASLVAGLAAVVAGTGALRGSYSLLGRLRRTR